jgi:hypothetical protein
MSNESSLSALREIVAAGVFTSASSLDCGANRTALPLASPKSILMPTSQLEQGNSAFFSVFFAASQIANAAPLNSS